MDPEEPSTISKMSNRSLAHTVLIELLSHQFASPVRWIETQDEILNRSKNVERIVEIGPSPVLATIAKKTINRKYLAQDTSRSIERQVLSSEADHQAIYYEYEDAENETSQNPGGTGTSDGPAPAIPVAQPVPVTTQPPPETAVASMPLQIAKVVDVPLSPADVLLAIVGRKLRKAFDEISQQASIRVLSGGKSTIQNEIIGDLHAEFSRLPDEPEDEILATLATSLEPNFNKQLGKMTSSLSAKLISSKMPGGFNQAAIADYLGSYWGLGSGRQMSVLCLAITIEPSSRLPSVEAAKEWLDQLLQRYSAYTGVSLLPNTGPVSANIATQSESAETNSSKADSTAQQGELSEHIAKLLKLDHPAHQETEVKDDDDEFQAAQTQLNLWNEEFNEDFAGGIKPQFDAAKVRKYDSSWNWVREDLISLFYEIAKDGVPPSSPRIERILHRWNTDCQDLVQFYASESHVKRLWEDLHSAGLLELEKDPAFKYTETALAPKTAIGPTGKIEYTQVPRKASASIDISNQVEHANRAEFPSYVDFIKHGKLKPETDFVPFIHLRGQVQGEWKYDHNLTSRFIKGLDKGSSLGFTFARKTVLITGAGPQSIGAEVARGLLAGGASVIVTTSRDITEASKFYQALYKDFGARGSSLVVLPFNAGSKKDTELLIEHIFDEILSPGDGLDFVLPFAAISERGFSLDSLTGKAELAHRAMLTNVLRLFGHIKKQKELRGLRNRPTNAILPLSPNHGTFGGDGLYGESKIGLETLFNRWHSEDWSDYLTICGAVIGWTRGTSLMDANDAIAEAVESSGVLTFSAGEMAFNILSLMTPEMSMLCEDRPIYVDLAGGLHPGSNLKEVSTSARANINKESKLRGSLRDERLQHEKILGGPSGQGPNTLTIVCEKKRADLGLEFPKLSLQPRTSSATDLQGMIDLSRTIVVVGFSELSPWGSARTRWEMEHQGTFSIEGWVEMAWITGFVKHFQGEILGKPYSGWVDMASGEPIEDGDIPKRYGDSILKHSGLRFIEPEGLGGYDPQRKELLCEVVLNDDLPAFETTGTEADAFKLRHGDKVSVTRVPNSEECRVQVKKGAAFLIPKAIPFDRQVAGQLPKGWDPLKYGIPEDIVSQVDPITIYALCCMSEALLSAGIMDPFELYKHIHVSEVANCLGTGCGGLLSMRGIYKDRYLDKTVQGDILQESYLNCLGAWTNMLLLGSAGPIRSPTGTCATAIESLDTGCEAIQSGKVQVAFVGGSDDFQEEMSYEFANMKATASSDEHLRTGRPPSEMSRPMTTSRNGFVESAGAGVQIIMTAELALKMGLPIYAIVAHTAMAGDSIGRSVPAPGQGIMTAAKENPEAKDSPLLDLEFRRSNIREEVASIDSWRRAKIAALSGLTPPPEKVLSAIDVTAECRIKDIQNLWGHDMRKQDPGISPIRAALAVWNLDIDDIQVASMHGTSTKANDTNESRVIHQMMEYLGRSRGNPLLAVTQKHLTGHPKGASGAWMFNGCLQILGTGVIPGNRNADNIDPALQKFSHIAYPSREIWAPRIKAVMLTSFGFGQKGAIALSVAPEYLFSAVDDATYSSYRTLALKRQSEANTAFLQGLLGNSIFKAKLKPAWYKTGVEQVLLDPAARISRDIHGEYLFDTTSLHGDGVAPKVLPVAAKQSAVPSILPNDDTNGTGRQTSLALESRAKGWLDRSLGRNPRMSSGVDVEKIADVPWQNVVFVKRNFTMAEQTYCLGAPDQGSSFAGRWSAKEAVFKSLQSPSAGAGAPLNEISIEADIDGVPRVKLLGKLREMATARGLADVQVSITHSEGMAMAVAFANYEDIS